MNNKLFIGNLSWGATEEDLQTLFADYGNVAEVRIITERDTGRSKGYGFVTFETAEEAGAALEALNETEFMERTMYVSEARPQENRE